MKQTKAQLEAENAALRAELDETRKMLADAQKVAADLLMGARTAPVSMPYPVPQPYPGLPPYVVPMQSWTGHRWQIEFPPQITCTAVPMTTLGVGGGHWQ